MENNSKIIKEKAIWVGSPKRVVLQLLVSIKSYFTFPFSKLREEAVMEYFKEIYSGKEDPLLFDGKDFGYLIRIKKVHALNSLKDSNILDFGCGNGAVFRWLETEKIKPKSYTGFDFAHESKEIQNNVKIIQYDMSNDTFPEVLDKYLISRSSNIHIFFVNTLCYLQSHSFMKLIRKFPTGSKMILIEPVPGIFWDVHFQGVKPIYRKEKYDN